MTSHMQASLTLLVWGYIHFTYIVNSKDCLLNLTDRPLPQDTIVQVEVYANSSEIWFHRERALQDMFKKKYNEDNQVPETDRKQRSMTDEWIRDYCGTSFLVTLTGTKFFCQLILTEFFKALDNSPKNSTEESNTAGATEQSSDTTEEDNEGVEGVSTDADEENVRKEEEDKFGWHYSSDISNSTSARITFYDVVMGSGHRDPYADLAASSFYSKNHTLYDLFDFYSELQAIPNVPFPRVQLHKG